MKTELTDLLDRLRTGNDTERAAAAEQLSRLGEDARGTAPGLVQACGDPSEPVREWAVAALEEIGPPEASDLAQLAELLGDPTPDVAYWAATLLGRLGASAGSAVPRLGEMLTNRDEKAVRERIVWALGEIGPAAEPQLDLLRKLAEGPDRRLARLAARAVSRITETG